MNPHRYSRLAHQPRPASTATAPKLTREQAQAILVQPLEIASAFLASGPRVFDTNGSPARAPKMGRAGKSPAQHRNK